MFKVTSVRVSQEPYDTAGQYQNDLASEWNRAELPSSAYFLEVKKSKKASAIGQVQDPRRSRSRWIVPLLVSSVIGVLGFVLPRFWSQSDADRDRWVDSRITLANKDRDAKSEALGTQITELRGSVIELRASMKDHNDLLKILLGKQIKQTAGLSPGDFQDKLDEVAPVLRAARVEGVRAPKEAVTALKSRMLETSADAPGFWPAASALISYASHISAKGPSDSVTPLQCLGSASRYFHNMSRPTKPIGGAVSKENGCVLVLDHNKLENYTCTQCLIRYGGGPVEIGKNVVFDDCVFELAIEQRPPKEGADFTKFLLARAGLSKQRLVPTP